MLIPKQGMQCRILTHMHWKGDTPKKGTILVSEEIKKDKYKIYVSIEDGRCWWVDIKVLSNQQCVIKSSDTYYFKLIQTTPIRLIKIRSDFDANT
jgi:hypothetical protein